MVFEWHLPTQIIFGAGRFSSTHKYVRGLGKRTFILTSPSFAQGKLRGVLDELLAQLKKIGVEYQIFGEIEPNPRTTTIDQAATAAREFRPRYIIGLGGGSVMDAAKCVSLLCENEGKVYEYAYRGPGKPMRPFNHAAPLVCIPTVAATSSETDFYAVVTQWEEHRKVTVFGDALMPKVSIIDPELTYTVPAQQTVDGAFDMITHVMESYLSTPVPTPIQDRLTEAIVETVVRHLPRVLENPKNALGRSQLSWCASLALSGALSGREGGWPIHALEHGLSAWTDVAHGRGLALLLPRIISFDLPVISEKVLEFNRRIFGITGTADATHAHEKGLVSYMKQVGAWTTLADIAPKANLDDLIEKTADHALEIKGIWKKGEEPYLDNSRPLRRKDAIEVLKNCSY